MVIMSKPENEPFRKLQTQLRELGAGGTNASVMQVLANMCREEESIRDRGTYLSKREHKKEEEKIQESFWRRRFVRHEDGTHSSTHEEEDVESNLFTRYVKRKYRGAPQEEEKKPETFSENIQHILLKMTSQFGSAINDAYVSDPSQIAARGNNDAIQAMMIISQIDENMKAIDEDMRILDQVKKEGLETATNHFTGFGHLGEQECLIDGRSSLESSSEASSESTSDDSSGDWESDSEDDSDRHDSSDSDDDDSEWDSDVGSSLDSNFMAEMANELGFQIPQEEDDEPVDVSFVKAIASGRKSLPLSIPCENQASATSLSYDATCIAEVSKLLTLLPLSSESPKQMAASQVASEGDDSGDAPQGDSESDSNSSDDDSSDSDGSTVDDELQIGVRCTHLPIGPIISAQNALLSQCSTQISALPQVPVASLPLAPLAPLATPDLSTQASSPDESKDESESLMCVSRSSPASLPVPVPLSVSDPTANAHAPMLSVLTSHLASTLPSSQAFVDPVTAPLSTAPPSGLVLESDYASESEESSSDSDSDSDGSSLDDDYLAQFAATVSSISDAMPAPSPESASINTEPAVTTQIVASPVTSPALPHMLRDPASPATLELEDSLADSGGSAPEEDTNIGEVSEGKDHTVATLGVLPVEVAQSIQSESFHPPMDLPKTAMPTVPNLATTLSSGIDLAESDSEDDSDDDSEGDSSYDSDDSDDSLLDDDYLAQFEATMSAPPPVLEEPPVPPAPVPQNPPAALLAMQGQPTPSATSLFSTGDSASSSSRATESSSEKSAEDSKKKKGTNVFGAPFGIGANVGCFDATGKPNEKAAARCGSYNKSPLRLSIDGNDTQSDLCIAARLKAAADEQMAPFAEMRSAKKVVQSRRRSIYAGESGEGGEKECLSDQPETFFVSFSNLDAVTGSQKSEDASSYVDEEDSEESDMLEEGNDFCVSLTDLRQQPGEGPAAVALGRSESARRGSRTLTRSHMVHEEDAGSEDDAICSIGSVLVDFDSSGKLDSRERTHSTSVLLVGWDNDDSGLLVSWGDNDGDSGAVEPHEPLVSNWHPSRAQSLNHFAELDRSQLNLFSTGCNLSHPARAGRPARAQSLNHLTKLDQPQLSSFSTEGNPGDPARAQPLDHVAKRERSQLKCFSPDGLQIEEPATSQESSPESMTQPLLASDEDKSSSGSLVVSPNGIVQQIAMESDGIILPEETRQLVEENDAIQWITEGEDSVDIDESAVQAPSKQVKNIVAAKSHVKLRRRSSPRRISFRDAFKNLQIASVEILSEESTIDSGVESADNEATLIEGVVLFPKIDFSIIRRQRHDGRRDATTAA
jgi:hypothetical protein